MGKGNMYDETMVQPAYPQAAHQPAAHQPAAYQPASQRQPAAYQTAPDHVLGPEVLPNGREKNNKRVIAILIACIVALNVLGAVIVLATRSSSVALTSAEAPGQVTSVPPVPQVPEFPVSG